MATQTELFPCDHVWKKRLRRTDYGAHNPLIEKPPVIAVFDVFFCSECNQSKEIPGESKNGHNTDFPVRNHV